LCDIRGEKLPRQISRTVAYAKSFDQQACLGEFTLQQQVSRDLNDITSNLTHWANVESLYLGTNKNDILNKFKLLESDLVKLYTAVLEMEVELVSWVPDRGIGMTLHPILDLRLSHYTSARVAKELERAVTWKNLTQDISSYHGICKNTFDDCKMKIDQHDKIREWISEYRPEAAHNDILERTGVDQKYRTCGQWLFDMPKFRDWSSREPAQDYRILWLRGTS
jgi:hypothetical protein